MQIRSLICCILSLLCCGGAFWCYRRRYGQAFAALTLGGWAFLAAAYALFGRG